MSKLSQILKRDRVHPELARLKFAKRTKAPADTRGNLNRRLITLEKFTAPGPHSQLTGQFVERESQLHFTKGRRHRAA